MYIGGQSEQAIPVLTFNYKFISCVNPFFPVALPHCLQNNPTKPGMNPEKKASANCLSIDRMRSVRMLIIGK